MKRPSYIRKDGKKVGKKLPKAQKGREPIYVTDPNDPRLKAYSDSLATHNLSRKIEKIFDVNPVDSKLENYNKQAAALSRRTGIKPVEIKGSLGWREPFRENRGPIDDVYMALYKKPVQPIKYKKTDDQKTETKKEKIKREYEDYDEYQKAVKAEKDSTYLFNKFNIPGHKVFYANTPITQNEDYKELIKRGWSPKEAKKFTKQTISNYNAEMNRRYGMIPQGYNKNTYWKNTGYHYPFYKEPNTEPVYVPKKAPIKNESLEKYQQETKKDQNAGWLKKDYGDYMRFQSNPNFETYVDKSSPWLGTQYYVREKKQKGGSHLPKAQIMGQSTYVAPSAKLMAVQKEFENKQKQQEENEYLDQILKTYPTLKDRKQAKDFVKIKQREEMRGPDQLRQTPEPQSKIGKFVDVAANPFLALDTYRTTGTLPDYFTEKDIASTTGALDIPYFFTNAGFVTSAAETAKNLPSTLANMDYTNPWDYAGLGLDLAMIVPGVKGVKKIMKSPVARLAKRKAAPYIKPVATLATDVARAVDNAVITPIQFRKEIKELKELHKAYPETFKKPEVQERLKKLGINPEDIAMPDLKFISGIGSEFQRYGKPYINIDFRQDKALQKLGYKFSPRSTYEHELGHHLQYEAFKPTMKKRYKEYGKAYESYRNNLSNWEKILEGYQKNPNISNSKIRAHMANKPMPPDMNALMLKPSNIDQELRNIRYSPYKINPKKLEYYKSGKWAGHMTPITPERSMAYFQNMLEPMPHLREMRQGMIESGIISNPYQEITGKNILEYVKANPNDRIASFISERSPNIIKLKNILNRLPAAAPVIGAGAALGSQQEYQKGGALPKAQKGPLIPPQFIDPKMAQVMANQKPQPQLKPSYKSNKQMEEEARRGEYIENPSFMDYLGQTGYMPYAFLKDPFNMGETLKQARKVASDPKLNAYGRVKKGIDEIVNPGLPQVAANLAIGELAGGLANAAIKKAIPAPQMMSNLFTSLPKGSLTPKTQIDIDLTVRNPLLGEPLGTAEDLANRSALQRGAGDSYLFNPENSTWENLSKEINNKYRQGYTDIPQFNQQLREQMATMQFGKRPTLSKDDFFTNKELINLIKQYKDYYAARETFENMNPESPSMMIFKAMSGDKSSEEAFKNLFPNAKLPNFRSKFINPAELTEFRNTLKYEPQFQWSDPLNPRTLKSNLQNRLTKENRLTTAAETYKDMLSRDWYLKDPKGYLKEMKGAKSFQGLSDSEIKAKAKEVNDKLLNFYKKRYLEDTRKPLRAIEALQWMEPNKKGGQISKQKAKGGAVSYMKKDGTKVSMMKKGGQLRKYQINGQTQPLINQSQEFLKAMAQSPLFAERYAKMTGVENSENAEKAKQQILENLANVQYKQTPKVLRKDAYGIYYPQNHKVMYANPEFSTLLHETSHASTKGNKLLTKEQVEKLANKWNYNPAYGSQIVEDTFGNYDNKEAVENLKNAFQNLSEKIFVGKNPKQFAKNKKYYTNPSEQKARIDVARQFLSDKGLYDPINQNFTEEDYNKLKDEFLKPGLFQRLTDEKSSSTKEIYELLNNYSKEDVIDMFNSYVSNKSNNLKGYAKKGGQLRRYQNGNQVQSDPYKQYYDIPQPKSLSESPSWRTYTYGIGRSYHPVHEQELMFDNNNFKGVREYIAPYVRFDETTGFNYQIDPETNQPFGEIDMEGDKKLNLQRFIINPYTGQEQTKDLGYKSKKGSYEDMTWEEPFPQTKNPNEQKGNIFKDLYIQNLVKYKGNRDEAYKASTDFMKKRVEPLFEGAWYEYNNNPNTPWDERGMVNPFGSNMSVDPTQARSYIDQTLKSNYLKKFQKEHDLTDEQFYEKGKKLLSKNWEEEVEESNEYKKELDRLSPILEDYYIRHKGYTPEDAKNEVTSKLYKKLIKEPIKKLTEEEELKNNLFNAEMNEDENLVKKSKKALDDYYKKQKIKKLKGGPIVTTEGFKMGPPPKGNYYRIPSDTLYNPTDYTIEAIADTGERKVLQPRTGNTKFAGASYVDEYQMKKGGQLPSYQTDGEYLPFDKLPKDPFERMEYYKKSGFYDKYAAEIKKPSHELKPVNKIVPKKKPLETNKNINTIIKETPKLSPIGTYATAHPNFSERLEPSRFQEFMETVEDEGIVNAFRQLGSYFEQKFTEPEEDKIEDEITIPLIKKDSSIIRETPKTLNKKIALPDIQILTDTIQDKIDKDKIYVGMSVNANKNSFGFRNRFEESDIKTTAGIGHTYNPFRPFNSYVTQIINGSEIPVREKHFEKEKPNSYNDPVIAININTGKLSTGIAKNFNKDWALSRALPPKEVSDIYVGKEGKRKENLNNKRTINLITPEGKTVSGQIAFGNTGYEMGGRGYDGGTILISTPDQKHTQLVYGSAMALKDQLNKFKESYKVDKVLFYDLDQKAFSQAVQSKSGVLKGTSLRQADNTNSSGGHLIYIKDKDQKQYKKGGSINPKISYIRKDGRTVHK